MIQDRPPIKGPDGTKPAITATDFWRKFGPQALPFADAVSDGLPMVRLLRLSLFQVSVGIVLVLLNATLNRVMIVELGVGAGFVSAVIALPVLFAPVRVLVGHRSDHHRSFLGWRRVPYIWMGTMLQFGGLAIMPFALLILSGTGQVAPWIGMIAAAVSFLMTGAGLHTAQTSGLALASDLAEEAKRPRVVAFLYVILLLGMGLAALLIGELLATFTEVRLIQVIQGCALVTILLNMVALWKQEARGSARRTDGSAREALGTSWARLSTGARSTRLLVAVGLGSAAFAMQEILLEPYGGEILGLSVANTTMLTALLSLGTLLGFIFAARWLTLGAAACQVAAIGAVVGLFAFPAIIAASGFQSVAVFCGGCLLIGLGTGLFLIGGLTAAMDLGKRGDQGLALGAWGAVHALATGAAIMVGGMIRDMIAGPALAGSFGPSLAHASTGYVAVYLTEIVLILITLIAIGPLVRHDRIPRTDGHDPIGLAHFPG